MKKMKIEDLVVSSFVTDSAIRLPSSDDPTPNTGCFDCIHTDHDCPKDTIDGTA